MTKIIEKVPPSTKPPTKPPTPTTTNGPPPKPATVTTAATNVSQKFPPSANGNRPYQRLAAHYDGCHQPHGGSCCTCRCCCLTIMWTTFIIATLLLLTAITATVLYVLYRPRPPSFSLSSLKITNFNLTSPLQFTSNINISIITKNPNEKITFYYKPINVTILDYHNNHQNIVIGQGLIPKFIHNGKNTTSLFGVIKNNSSNTNPIDDISFGHLKFDLNKKNHGRLNLKVEMETYLKVKIGDKLKSNWFKLRTSCNGIKAFAYNGKLNGKVDIDGAKCKVYLIIKCFEWDISI
ncbi:NDR1/HIN1-like protein 6 [Amaranthus tricolor]|uniref:NDR1/HIN1-like protein 6 n=1 Tax=Amaranthus tricolor TaxID=29722 RepID=UPI002583E5B5|nr:NDR1/HIN1-like protein 6 [Amaranthus tricolor]